MDKICCLCRLSLPADSMMQLHGRSCEKANPAAVPLDQLVETIAILTLP